MGYFATRPTSVSAPVRQERSPAERFVAHPASTSPTYIAAELKLNMFRETGFGVRYGRRRRILFIVSILLIVMYMVTISLILA
jgi:hypothetical protein